MHRPCVVARAPCRIDGINIITYASACLGLSDAPGVFSSEVRIGFWSIIAGYLCGVAALILKGVVPAKDLRTAYADGSYKPKSASSSASSSTASAAGLPSSSV